MAPRVGIITQARMTSTRLPGKIMMEAGGKVLLKHHTDRLKQSGLPVFIATTVNQTDDPVVHYAEKENLPFYRGSEDHVLSRFYECASKYELEVVVRVTSDCPLIDGALIRESIDLYNTRKNDELYLSNCLERTFPRGLDFEIFSFELLKEAYTKASAASDIEHVTPYINQNRSGKVKFEHILNKSDDHAIRITVDTPEDFSLIKILIEQYKANELGYKSIIDLFEQHPELKLINANIEQKKI